MRRCVGMMCSWGGGYLLVHLAVPHLAVAAALLQQRLAPLLPMPTPLTMCSLVLVRVCWPAAAVPERVACLPGGP